MIVFPMAGLSSRFAAAGYAEPKYMLEIAGKSVFRWAVEGLLNAVREPVLFIYRDIAGTGSFIRRELERMPGAEWRMAALANPTTGQAATVLEGLHAADVDFGASLTIFNIDTFRRNFGYPEFLSDPETAGYLEVFSGSGANWSFVRPAPDGGVAETAEKIPLSVLCCTGLYHFKSAALFEHAYNACYRPGDGGAEDGREHYIAPIYNSLISEGYRIRYHLIDSDDVAFCGTPDEYRILLDNFSWA